MKDIQLDAETRLLMAIGFLIGRLEYGGNNAKVASALIIEHLQEKLDVRILGLDNFRIGTWINEILSKEVFTQK